MKPYIELTKEEIENLSPERKHKYFMKQLDELKLKGWKLVPLKSKDGKVCHIKGFQKTIITSFDEAMRYEARGLSYEEDTDK